MFRSLLPLLARLALVLAVLLAGGPAAADPADIDAAARGVVRVVVIGRNGEEIFAISHGTGFAVAPEMVVTNAHVVSEALDDPGLVLGIVPSDGGQAVFGRLVAVSRRNDLALLTTTSPMRLPPLTIAGNPESETGAVTSVGYPQNVDRAQGLAMEDLFVAQPPVKSTGFLSGRRPSRDFDTLLHTAPIARGSSGGPLLDECGRVIGINSFGTDSGSADAEFFFAVSTRELLPFLRANEVDVRVNGLPCRSLDELEAAETAREQQQRAAADAEAAAAQSALASRREEARREAEFAVIEQRDDLMGLSFLLVVVALGAGGIAWRQQLLHEDTLADEPDEPERRYAFGTLAAGAVALAALAGAAGAWYARPSFRDVDAVVANRLREAAPAGADEPLASGTTEGTFACTLVEERSRVTGEPPAALNIDLSAGGCVNGRTQYGQEGGAWTRVFVPAEEAAVSVSRFDPADGEFVTERYLLGSEAMREARVARSRYEAPSCAATAEEARAFGGDQASLAALLPARPNERLVYTCRRTG